MGSGALLRAIPTREPAPSVPSTNNLRHGELGDHEDAERRSRVTAPTAIGSEAHAGECVSGTAPKQ